MKRLLKTALVLGMMLSLLLVVGCGSSAPSGSGEKVKVTIKLVLEDQTEVPYEISVTDGATLREALAEGGLISEEQESAMFISDIDGHIADPIKDAVTWLPTDENGEQIMGTFDEITVSADQTITLVYSPVPNFDD